MIIYVGWGKESTIYKSPRCLHNLTYSNMTGAVIRF